MTPLSKIALLLMVPFVMVGTIGKLESQKRDQAHIQMLAAKYDSLQAIADSTQSLLLTKEETDTSAILLAEVVHKPRPKRHKKAAKQSPFVEPLPDHQEKDTFSIKVNGTPKVIHHGFKVAISNTNPNLTLNNDSIEVPLKPIVHEKLP